MDQIQSIFKSKWLIFPSWPFVSYTHPKIFSKEVNRGTSIIVDVVDSLFGVDYSSIVMIVNGYDVTNLSTISPINGGFRVHYKPSIGFYWNAEVSVVIKAANNNGVYMPDYQYWFMIESRKLNTMIEEAVHRIAEKVDWSQLE